MRTFILALAATSLVACVDNGPEPRRVIAPDPLPLPRADPVLPEAPEVRSSTLPPSGAPVPSGPPVIVSSAPTSPDPERSGCLITYPDGTRAVQRRTADGNMQQTPADFLDAALVDGLEPC